MSDIKSLIEFQAEQNGDKVFLIDPSTNETITFRQLLHSVRNVAGAVKDTGVKPGQSVAYALTNGVDCALIILGLFYGGYRATAINLIAGPSTIAYVLEHSKSQIIITQSEHDELLDQSLANSPKSLKRFYAKEFLSNQNNHADAVSTDNIMDASHGLLMYTSGTTGRPKGVVLTHKNLLAGGGNTITAHELTSADRAMCVLPLYHINGLCVTLMGPLKSGGSVVMPDKFSTSAFWQQVCANECTWFSVVPTHISYLLHDKRDEQFDKQRLRQIRFGRSASAPLSPEVQNAFEERFGIPIIETMGLTETAAPILSNPLQPGCQKIGSPGIAFGNEVIIADAHQNEIANGLEGEILVRGDNVMQMYFENEDATNDALTDQGWLRTGDLGRQDQDGYFFITGRLKELIIKGGENIAPREIDDALYAHADVIEAAAFACPCKNYGQTVEAAVKTASNSSVTERELLAFCRQRLGPVKTPDKIHFLSELPKGPSGKIQRAQIVDLI